MNWDRFTVRALETGKRQNITVAELLALANLFNTNPMALLGSPNCTACADAPPQGFTCNACGR